MNLLQIDREFKKLRMIEDYITFKFEPRSTFQNGKRHIYYKDLKSDFVDEVNAYGFSPFIQKTYEQQKKDKNIMRYKNKDFQNGLLNFVKKSHGKGQDKVIIQSKINPVEENDQNGNNDLFLQKALENLAKNKLHYTEDSNDITAENLKLEEKKEKEEIEKKDKRLLSSIKKKDEKPRIIDSKPINYKVNINPFLSFSGFNQPEPIKKNFDKFFNTINRQKTSKSYLIPKRQIAIFKTKAIENHLKNREELKRSVSDAKKFNDPVEWNRNEVDLAETIKIINKKEKNNENVLKTNPKRSVLVNTSDRKNVIKK